MIYYMILIIALLWGKDGRKVRFFRCACIILGAVVLLGKIPDKKMNITFLDVGQGDCACIRTESGNCYLVDGEVRMYQKSENTEFCPF